MKYICVDTVEFLYTDITEYQSGTDRINILTPRGSYACAQILLTEGCGNINIECNGWKPEIYEMVAVKVEANPMYVWNKEAPHTPEKKAPFEVYDCLKPYQGSINFKNGQAAVYFSMLIPKDAPIGTINGTVTVNELGIPVTIEVSSAVVPQETLSVVMWYSKKNIRKYHKLEECSSELDDMETKYLKMMRRQHQNGTNISARPKIKVVGKDKYEFDFSDMEISINKLLSLGFTKFTHDLDVTSKPDSPHIFVYGDVPCTSLEGYSYLAQFLTALSKFIREHGWCDKFLLGVYDEPQPNITMEYKALCGIIRKFAPDIKTIVAINEFGVAEGCVDIPIPLNWTYTDHMEEYEAYREYDDELWYYDCMGPRGEGYINRFLDYALISTRYHGWGNYKYNMTGYLHWAINQFMKEQDPFKQSCVDCGVGGNEYLLPPGDTHIVYPGEYGPWMSVRLESYRASFEEYEMLRTVALKDKKTADDICESVFRSFKDVEYDPRIFRTERNKLIRALESLS
ncbi:MAG: DUF4091 domain-containing protein [Clostridia bacterium]|nr:DUF4091 domain-containing protein [Clostridia bacterium]